MPGYFLTNRARRDIADIGAYTRKRWGRARQREYLAALMLRIRALSERPEIGVARESIRPGYRSALQGGHVIFYRVLPKGIEIVRVLHQRMDVKSLITKGS